MKGIIKMKKAITIVINPTIPPKIAIFNGYEPMYIPFCMNISDGFMKYSKAKAVPPKVKEVK